MRVLIISALFAYAAGAPYTIVSPLVYQTQLISAAVPTISPGDIQGAAIEAQVQFNDLSRTAVDQAVATADAINQSDDLNKERNEEAFWSNEDKNWQAVDALKTAEAAVDGAVASNADVYAKAAIGVVPAVAPASPVVTSVLSPSISPLVYTSYVTAVNRETTPTAEVKTEEKKEEKQEAAVKTAEPEKPAVTETAAKVEAATENPIVLTNTIVTPYSSVYGLGFPLLRSYFPQNVINYASIQPVLTPSYVNVW